MTRKADLVVKDGLEYVETEDHLFGLGLQLPKVKTQMLPTLADSRPLLEFGEIRRIVESSEFSFGREMFDSSWITNQNGYGSCAGYGSASSLAKSRVIAGQSREDLSGDYLYSLTNGGRDRGSMLDDNMMAMVTRGVALASTVPLGGIYRNSYDSTVADSEALRFRAMEPFATPDEQSVATALAFRIPTVVAIHVTNAWRQFDSDDVLSPLNNGPGNHCEHLDDIKYDSKRGCFLYRKATSHGVSYSDDGYCWTVWDHHYKTPSRYHQFYALPTASQDPHGSNPPGSEHERQPATRIVLVAELTESCVWCRRWRENELPKVTAAGYEIRFHSVSGGQVPAFELQVDELSRTHIGYWRFEDIAVTANTLRT